MAGQRGNASFRKADILLFCLASLLVAACFMLSSCITIPGEDELEDQKRAADYYDIATGYSELKKYDKAITFYLKCLELTQDTIQVKYQLARNYAFSGKWTEAASLFEELLEIDPDNSLLTEAYAYSLYKKGDREKALSLYEELSKKNSADEKISTNYELLLTDFNDEKALSEDSSETADEAQSEDQDASAS